MHASLTCFVLLVLTACTPEPDSAAILSTTPTTEPTVTTPQDRLRADVSLLSGPLADRRPGTPAGLEKAAEAIEASLQDAGWPSRREGFTLSTGVEVFNIIAERAGTDPDGAIVLIGAHYDAAKGTPGADDNASGVAALLEIARRLSEFKPGRTVRLVFFTTEEPPYFQTPEMGSLVHALGCRERAENIAAMVALDCIGYFDDAPGSQRYPMLRGLPATTDLPDTGDFIAVLSRSEDADLVTRVDTMMKEVGTVPVLSVTLPGASTLGAGWSDHWSFWQHGYPGVMITDTAFARNPNYHQESDTADTLDYDRLAGVVEALVGTIRGLAAEP
jgi:Zn-dependent M28 family amino/carboxypeptidase